MNAALFHGERAEGEAAAVISFSLGSVCFDDTETRPMEPNYGVLFISGINKLSVGTSAFVDRKSLRRV